MENNIMQLNENCLRCSRKRKRNNKDNNYRKRKFEEDLDDIIITKFQKIDITNDNKYIINRKRLFDDINDDINDDIVELDIDIIKLKFKKQKINKTYNCALHDDTKEICLVYNCLGNTNINDNNVNIVYNYIK